MKIISSKKTEVFSNNLTLCKNKKWQLHLSCFQIHFELYFALFHYLQAWTRAAVAIHFTFSYTQFWQSCWKRNCLSDISQTLKGNFMRRSATTLIHTTMQYEIKQSRIFANVMKMYCRWSIVGKNNQLQVMLLNK